MSIHLRPRASRRAQGVVDGRTVRQVGHDRNERLVELGLLSAQGVLNPEPRAGRTLQAVERPVDAVTAAVLALQMAQRDVDLLIREVIERVSADPFAESSHPDFRVRLSELREEVDRAADELIDALARMGDESEPD